jgi:AcrR family transcriptional regulator
MDSDASTKSVVPILSSRPVLEVGTRILGDGYLRTAREIEIVRSTYHVMARVGTQQLSLRQVAKEAKVSPQLLIYYFRTKENLLLQTMRWALAGTVRRIEENLTGITDPYVALERLLDAVFVNAKANRDFQLVYLDLVQYAERHASFGGLAELLRAHINGSYALVVGHGVEQGVFTVDDVDLAARRARAIVEGSSLQWLQDPNWQTTHGKLRDECHAALLELLTTPRAG